MKGFSKTIWNLEINSNTLREIDKLCTKFKRVMTTIKTVRWISGRYPGQILLYNILFKNINQNKQVGSKRNQNILKHQTPEQSYYLLLQLEKMFNREKKN